MAITTSIDLQQLVRTSLAGRRFVVVSRRTCMPPASGLATALDPLLRASGGVWVAHGSGSADRLVVDSQDRALRIVPLTADTSLIAAIGAP